MDSNINKELNYFPEDVKSTFWFFFSTPIKAQCYSACGNNE